MDGLKLQFPEHDRRTAHQLVKDTLRRAILDGSLAGGTRLVQAEVAARLGVSTTPVREALRDLATEGLVRLDAHRGAVVHEVTPEELDELYDLRRLLEPEAVRRAAANLTVEELDELDALQRRMDAEDDVIKWIGMNRSLHQAIADAAGSKRLAQLLHRLEDEAAMYVGVSLRRQHTRLASGNVQHHALLDALRRRDGDAAAAAILDHLGHTQSLASSGLPDDGT